MARNRITILNTMYSYGCLSITINIEIIKIEDIEAKEAYPLIMATINHANNPIIVMNLLITNSVPKVVAIPLPPLKFKNIGGEVIEVEVKSKYLDKIIISRVFTDVDYIINVPKFKTHGLVKITGAIKNMYGMIPGGKKAQLHTLNHSVKEFAELLVDIYQIRIPDLNIMDAIIGMEGNGPTNGKPRSINKILCSDNGVAIDTVMATMMGLQSSMIETIQIANERGLGEMDLHKIEIDGKLETISDFKTPEKGIFHKIGRFMTPYTFKYAQVKPIVDKQKCKKCYQCIKVCPTKAMQIKNGFPEADRKQCISCFCCDEHCPYSAIILPPWHIDLLNRIKGR